MNNPFEVIDARLSNIESLLLDLKHKKPEEKALKDAMLIDEALAYLAELGRPTSKSTLYKETCMNAIPHKRVGKRLVFSRAALRQWVEQGMPKQYELDAADRLKKLVK